MNENNLGSNVVLKATWATDQDPVSKKKIPLKLTKDMSFPALL